MELEITQLDARHKDGMLLIEKESFSMPWSESNFSTALTNPSVSFFGVFCEKILCGFSCVCQVETEAELLNIAVSKEYRKKGIGNILLTATVNFLKDSGAKCVFLEVRESNTAARMLYLKHGFNVLGIRKRYYSNPTEDAVLMKKQLQ